MQWLEQNSLSINKWLFNIAVGHKAIAVYAKAAICKKIIRKVRLFLSGHLHHAPAR
ncbi:MAG: hypothetical protein RL172_477 [Bacteroidota bacterium]